MSSTIERSVRVIHASGNDFAIMNQNAGNGGFTSCESLFGDVDGLTHKTLVDFQVLENFIVEFVLVDFAFWLSDVRHVVRVRGVVEICKAFVGEVERGRIPRQILEEIHSDYILPRCEGKERIHEAVATGVVITSLRLTFRLQQCAGMVATVSEAQHHPSSLHQAPRDRNIQQFMPAMAVSIIRSLLLWAAFACAVLAGSDAGKLPYSVTLYYQLLGSPSIEPLATFSYDHKSKKHALTSWTPPKLDAEKSTTPEPTSSRLLRILLPNGSATVTTLDTFSSDVHQKIDLWISPDHGSVFSASVSSLSPPPLTPEEERYKKKVDRAKAKGKPIPPPPPIPNTKKAREEAAKRAAANEPIKVNLLVSGPGPAPAFTTRKPPAVDSEGREIAQEEQQEKSFFQKYWWVFAMVALLSVTGGGGEK